MAKAKSFIRKLQLEFILGVSILLAFGLWVTASVPRSEPLAGPVHTTTTSTGKTMSLRGCSGTTRTTQSEGSGGSGGGGSGGGPCAKVIGPQAPIFRDWTGSDIEIEISFSVKVCNEPEPGEECSLKTCYCWNGSIEGQPAGSNGVLTVINNNPPPPPPSPGGGPAEEPCPTEGCAGTGSGFTVKIRVKEPGVYTIGASVNVEWKASTIPGAPEGTVCEGGSAGDAGKVTVVVVKPEVVIPELTGRQNFTSLLSDPTDASVLNGPTAAKRVEWFDNLDAEDLHGPVTVTITPSGFTDVFGTTWWVSSYQLLGDSRVTVLAKQTTDGATDIVSDPTFHFDSEGGSNISNVKLEGKMASTDKDDAVVTLTGITWDSQESSETPPEECDCGDDGGSGGSGGSPSEATGTTTSLAPESADQQVSAAPVTVANTRNEARSNARRAVPTTSVTTVASQSPGDPGSGGGDGSGAGGAQDTTTVLSIDLDALSYNLFNPFPEVEITHPVDALELLGGRKEFTLKYKVHSDALDDWTGEKNGDVGEQMFTINLPLANGQVAIGNYEYRVRHLNSIGNDGVDALRVSVFDRITQGQKVRMIRFVNVHPSAKAQFIAPLGQTASITISDADAAEGDGRSTVNGRLGGTPILVFDQKVEDPEVRPIDPDETDEIFEGDPEYLLTEILLLPGTPTPGSVMTQVTGDTASGSAVIKDFTGMRQGSSKHLFMLPSVGIDKPLLDYAGLTKDSAVATKVTGATVVGVNDDLEQGDPGDDIAQHQDPADPDLVTLTAVGFGDFTHEHIEKAKVEWEVVSGDIKLMSLDGTKVGTAIEFTDHRDPESYVVKVSGERESDALNDARVRVRLTVEDSMAKAPALHGQVFTATAELTVADVRWVNWKDEDESSGPQPETNLWQANDLGPQVLIESVSPDVAQHNRPLTLRGKVRGFTDVPTLTVDGQVVQLPISNAEPSTPANPNPPQGPFVAVWEVTITPRRDRSVIQVIATSSTGATGSDTVLMKWQRPGQGNGGGNAGGGSGGPPITGDLIQLPSSLPYMTDAQAAQEHSPFLYAAEVRHIGQASAAVSAGAPKPLSALKGNQGVFRNTRPVMFTHDLGAAPSTIDPLNNIITDRQVLTYAGGNGVKHALFPIDGQLIALPTGSLANGVEWANGARLILKDEDNDGYHDEFFAVSLNPIDPLVPGEGEIVIEPFTIEGEAAIEHAFGQSLTVDVANHRNGFSVPLRIKGRGVAGLRIRLFDEENRELARDRMRVSIGAFDLDIDSDNNDEHRVPARTVTEDEIEDAPDLPGKYVCLNDGDTDFDKVPGYADGFDRDGRRGTSDDHLSGVSFVPLVLVIPAGIDGSRANFTFTYSASDPKQIIDHGEGKPSNERFEPAPGHLRIWLKDAHEPRTMDDVSSGGDYVPADQSLTGSSLGVSPDDGGQVLVLYVEGIRPSARVGDLRIVVDIQPDNEAPSAGFAEAQDAVRVTVFGFQFVDDQTREAIEFASVDDLHPLVELDPLPPASLGAVDNPSITITGTVTTWRAPIRKADVFVNGIAITALDSNGITMPDGADGLGPFVRRFTSAPMRVGNGVYVVNAQAFDLADNVGGDVTYIFPQLDNNDILTGRESIDRDSYPARHTPQRFRVKLLGPDSTVLRIQSATIATPLGVVEVAADPDAPRFTLPVIFTPPHFAMDALPPNLASTRLQTGLGMITELQQVKIVSLTVPVTCPERLVPTGTLIVDSSTESPADATQLFSYATEFYDASKAKTFTVAVGAPGDNGQTIHVRLDARNRADTTSNSMPDVEEFSPKNSFMVELDRQSDDPSDPTYNLYRYSRDVRCLVTEERQADKIADMDSLWVIPGGWASATPTIATITSCKEFVAGIEAINRDCIPTREVVGAAPVPSIHLDEVNDIEVAETEAGAFVATFTVSGRVVDAVSANFDDPRLRISKVYIQGTTDATGAVVASGDEAAVTEVQGLSKDLFNPHPYEGTFSKRVHVRLQPGTNTVPVYAYNAIGAVGAGSVSINVHMNMASASGVDPSRMHRLDQVTISNPFATVSNRSLSPNIQSLTSYLVYDLDAVRDQALQPITLNSNDGVSLTMDAQKPANVSFLAFNTGEPALPSGESAVRKLKDRIADLRKKLNDAENSPLIGNSLSKQFIIQMKKDVEEFSESVEEFLDADAKTKLGKVVSGLGRGVVHVASGLIEGGVRNWNSLDAKFATGMTYEVVIEGGRLTADRIPDVEYRTPNGGIDPQISTVDRKMETKDGVARLVLTFKIDKEHPQEAAFSIVVKDGDTFLWFWDKDAVEQMEAVGLKTIVLAVDGLGWDDFNITKAAGFDKKDEAFRANVRTAAEAYFGSVVVRNNIFRLKLFDTYADLTNADSAGPRSGYLRAFGDDFNGASIQPVRNFLPTVTWCNWASVFTGRPPRETGVLGLTFFARDTIGDTNLDPIWSAGSTLGRKDVDVSFDLGRDAPYYRDKFDSIQVANFNGLDNLTTTQTLYDKGKATFDEFRTDVVQNMITRGVSNEEYFRFGFFGKLSAFNLLGGSLKGGVNAGTIPLPNWFDEAVDKISFGKATGTDAVTGLPTVSGESVWAGVILDQGGAFGAASSLLSYPRDRTKFPDILTVYLPGVDNAVHGHGKTFRDPATDPNMPALPGSAKIGDSVGDFMLRNSADHAALTVYRMVQLRGYQRAVMWACTADHGMANAEHGGGVDHIGHSNTLALDDGYPEGDSDRIQETNTNGKPITRTLDTSRDDMRGIFKAHDFNRIWGVGQERTDPPNEVLLVFGPTWRPVAAVNEFDAVFSPNGGLAHIYLRHQSGSWTGDYTSADLDKIEQMAASLWVADKTGLLAFPGGETATKLNVFAQPGMKTMFSIFHSGNGPNARRVANAVVPATATSAIFYRADGGEYRWLYNVKNTSTMPTTHNQLESRPIADHHLNKAWNLERRLAEIIGDDGGRQGDIVVILGDSTDEDGKPVLRTAADGTTLYSRKIAWISEDFLFGGWHGEPDEVTSTVPLIFGMNEKFNAFIADGISATPPASLATGDRKDVTNADLTNFTLSILKRIRPTKN